MPKLLTTVVTSNVSALTASVDVPMVSSSWTVLFCELPTV
jgi:hypothetical protein